ETDEAQAVDVRHAHPPCVYSCQSRSKRRRHQTLSPCGRGWTRSVRVRGLVAAVALSPHLPGVRPGPSLSRKGEGLAGSLFCTARALAVAREPLPPARPRSRKASEKEFLTISERCWRGHSNRLGHGYSRAPVSSPGGRPGADGDHPDP